MELVTLVFVFNSHGASLFRVFSPYPQSWAVSHPMSDNIISQYNDAPAPVDPYSDAYNAPPTSTGAVPLDPREREPLPPRGRSRSRSPKPYRRRSPPINKKNPTVSVIVMFVMPTILTPIFLLFLAYRTQCPQMLLVYLDLVYAPRKIT